MLRVLQEARATIVPDLADRHGPLPPLMLTLTAVTGLVDAFSYLTLGHVFVANMTGNVVFGGFALAGAPGFSLAASLTALVAFAAGALLGGQVAHRARAHRGRLLFAALLLETGLVVATWIIATIAAGPYAGGPRYVLIVLLGAGLGVQNAAARALAVPDLTTTVLTLTVTGVAADSRVAGGTGGKAGRRILAVLAMFAGALAGAALVEHGNPALPLLVAAVLLAAATVAAFTLSRSGGPWTDPL